MSFENSIQLLAPSYMMYADETGKTTATAIFAVGDPGDTIKVPLSTTTFGKVGGGPIGGPILVAIEITGEITATLYPEQSLTAKSAWAVLQRPPPNVMRIFPLRIFVSGETQTVMFTPVPPNSKSEDAGVPNASVTLVDGAIYNDLNSGLLSVEYNTPPNELAPKSTNPVPPGEDTGGVFSGNILSFNTILLGGVPQKWFSQEAVTSTKGLPIIVFGPLSGPKLAVVRQSGPPEIVNLIKLL